MNTTRNGHRRPRRLAFTLVEILVVVGIIVVLVGILAPAIAKGHRNGLRTKMAADLNAIAVALEAYRQDHGDIPRVTEDPAKWHNMGDALLCRALVAPLDAENTTDPTLQDGQNGNGFRVRPAIGGVPQGKPYGPYITQDKIKVVFDLSKNSMYLADHSGGRILYFAGRKGGNLNAVGGYVSKMSYVTVPTATNPRPLYNLQDVTNTTTPADDRIALFDNGVVGSGPDRFRILAGADANGRATDVALTGEFLLWAPGPDEKFGYDGPVDTNPDQVAKQRTASDDVTYPAR